MTDESQDKAANTPNVSMKMGTPDPNRAGNQQQIQVALNEAEVNTKYINYVVAEASPAEIVLNLAFHTQNSTRIQISDRVILSYSTAKRLGEILTATVKQYEASFGAVPTIQQATPGAGQGRSPEQN